MKIIFFLLSIISVMVVFSCASTATPNALLAVDFRNRPYPVMLDSTGVADTGIIISQSQAVSHSSGSTTTGNIKTTSSYTTERKSLFSLAEQADVLVGGETKGLLISNIVFESSYETLGFGETDKSDSISMRALSSDGDEE